MTQQSLIEIQADHKHWLAEIERWEDYLRTWQDQQQALVDEFKQILTSIEQHGQALQEHAQSLQAHKQEIIACERGMVEHSNEGDVAPQIAGRHAAGVDHHDAQRNTHERIKQEHHTFCAALSLLRHEPFREE